MKRKYENKPIVVGDLHADWGKLNTLINRIKPSLILQVGDFGFWPRMHGMKDSYDLLLEREFGINRKPFNQYGLKNGDVPIYFAPGNHEDWDSLELLTDNEVFDNVFYMRFGSLLTLPDGRVVMFCGGADSIDKESRIQGRDWFPQEIITYDDMKKLPPENTKVDIVISHTCPREFIVQMHNRGIIYFNEYKREHKDSSRDALSYIRDTFKPKYWYFGHYHRYTHGNWKETKWFALSMPNRTGWWKGLR